MDFIEISKANAKNGINVSPEFLIKPSKDILIKGKDFYAVWNEETGLWSTNEYDVVTLVDTYVSNWIKEEVEKMDSNTIHYNQMKMISTRNKTYDKYVWWKKQMRSTTKQLDSKIIFKSTKTKRSDYASFRLDYDLSEEPCPAYDELMGTLYSDEERQKIEWAIGSIISGESKHIQKFIVLKGAPGTGKSTVLNIIELLFPGYTGSFVAKDLASGTKAFATGKFAANKLIMMQHDGDLSNVKDNTLLNTIISHEDLSVNKKFKDEFDIKPISFLFMATNTDVLINDTDSGLTRRIIDVYPTGNRVTASRYKSLIKQLNFEKGSICDHCLKVFKELGENYYDSYVPSNMIRNTNTVYNFVFDNYFELKENDPITLKTAYSMYKRYAEETGEYKILRKMDFNNQLRPYYDTFNVQMTINGSHYNNVFVGLKPFADNSTRKITEPVEQTLILDKTESLLDKEYADCYAQYAKADGTPKKAWDDVKTKLGDLDTTKLHYMRFDDPAHIVIDFDIKDEEGNKSLERNLEAASKFPPTYAELSKGGCGVHLHYIWTGGDPDELSRLYDENIEVKVFTGKSSLRRRLSLCNDLPIATLSSGLPLKEKGGSKMVDFQGFKSRKKLEEAVVEAAKKGKPHFATKPNMDYIKMITDKAYESGMQYDLTTLRPAIMNFAANSSHQADKCLKILNEIHWSSEDQIDPELDDDSSDAPIVFYDVEVFPNLFLVNWKFEGEDKPVNRMINPTSEEVAMLFKYRLIGFNCRRYDNHIMWARYMGYTNKQLYKHSQIIINSDKSGRNSNAFFGEAYNLSYTDVYDYSATKQSLKKWEIELGIHHQELGLPWDKPVPIEKWELVAEYCDNDVIATEKVHEHLKADFEARKSLVDVVKILHEGTVKACVNDTTNGLSTKIMFGNERHPQSEFNYYFMGVDSEEAENDDNYIVKEEYDKFTVFDKHGRAFFPGYTFENGKSYYRGYEVGEGGMVWANPQMAGRSLTKDVVSMHPHSIQALNLFGDFYTKRFYDLVSGRVAIKRLRKNRNDKWAIETLTNVLGGALKRFIDMSDDILKNLANALKIVINSVYGLTAAKFENAFRDPRNIDNIVAKRGALFMINLKEAVEARGGEVLHIKTDSIKLINPTEEILAFVDEYGSLYGYTFETEHIFDRICLVNNAVYVAKLAEDDPEAPGEWTATGTQFQVPYVFKTLFTHEPIEFPDLCETKSVKGELYLDFDEDLEEDEHSYQFVGKVGNFCPIKPGCGGGVLYRYDGEKYSAATGTKGYRWKESEIVAEMPTLDSIDRSYYDRLVDTAIESISQFGDFEGFTA